MPAEIWMFIAAGAYGAIALAYLPETYRATAESWREEFGSFGAGGQVLCGFGAAAAACAWPVFALFQLITR